jgi:hypothetical protein
MVGRWDRKLFSLRPNSLKLCTSSWKYGFRNPAKTRFREPRFVFRFETLFLDQYAEKLILLAPTWRESALLVRNEEVSGSIPLGSTNRTPSEVGTFGHVLRQCRASFCAARPPTRPYPSAMLRRADQEFLKFTRVREFGIDSP